MLALYPEGYGYSKRLCEDVVCWFVSKYLPRHKLEIEVLHRGMKRESAYGYCDVAGRHYNPREFLIELDTHMDKETYTKTLLHELYHVTKVNVWRTWSITNNPTKLLRDGMSVSCINNT
jgi:hypothetical protein